MTLEIVTKRVYTSKVVTHEITMPHETANYTRQLTVYCMHATDRKFHYYSLKLQGVPISVVGTAQVNSEID